MGSVSSARRAGLVPLALSLMLFACSGDDPVAPDGPPADAPQVAATPQLAFTPQTLDIATGETVTWVFGSTAHNVTFAQTAGRPTDIPGQNANTAIGRTFATAGTFPYVCTLHPGMSGTIVVAAGASQIRNPGDAGGSDAGDPGDGGGRGYGN